MSKFYDSMLKHLADNGPLTLNQLFLFSKRPSIIGVKIAMNSYTKSKMVTYDDGTYEITQKGVEYLESLEGD
ncbi:hypothetical protein [Methanolobus sp.]|uniref:hypothetical protein n=1 Tax=Methanolobus sp. TaxID=1874737 RepID=UPI00260065FB|nr:hypothetical protein [Methanolobus sp.]